MMDLEAVMTHFGRWKCASQMAVQVCTNMCMLHEGKQNSTLGQPIRPEALTWKCTMVDLTDLEFL